MISKGIVLLHDNAGPHTAGVTQSLIRQFHWEHFDHPPYSPDLAPSDYHLFLHMKRELGDKRFGSDDDTKNDVVVVIETGGKFLWQWHTKTGNPL
ncbi:hypothetical protein R5R35_005028 [Gryllus longicercus]|uniref:Histone-lysine N-methyltransferase SETMAR n=1 Tax=Gryllus longicercus TaxID=2509291 RepID=A0AAN9VQL5_9ORTH